MDYRIRISFFFYRAQQNLEKIGIDFDAQFHALSIGVIPGTF